MRQMQPESDVYCTRKQTDHCIVKEKEEASAFTSVAIIKILYGTRTHSKACRKHFTQLIR